MEFLDLGNNEILARGIFPNSDKSWTALTLTRSRNFKTQAGAEKWLRTVQDEENSESSRKCDHA